jgi:hypothetical protein
MREALERQLTEAECIKLNAGKDHKEFTKLRRKLNALLPMMAKSAEPIDKKLSSSLKQFLGVFDATN